MMEIKTTVFQNPDCRYMFAVSPEGYRRALLGWLIRERGSFVGDKKKDGAFTRSILRKKISGASGTWDHRIAKAFKGYINNSNSLYGMSLRMGINLSNKSYPFAQAVARMEEGYKQITQKYMVVPILENQSLQRPRKLMLADFKNMRAKNLIYTIEKAGRLYYIDRDSRELLFVVTRSIDVPKQFDFIQAWKSRIPSVLQRGQKAVDNATKKIAYGGI